MVSSSGLSAAIAPPPLPESSARALTAGACGDTRKKNLAGEKRGMKFNVFPDVLNN